MAKILEEWSKSDLQEYRDQPVEWLSQYFFFRDPPRPRYSDPSYFLAPADGVIIYQDTVPPDQALVEIKGKPYSLRNALRDETFEVSCLVVAIFMTFYDVHINRIPYTGRLSYRMLDPIDTYNHPMLDVEHSLLRDLAIPESPGSYLRHNARTVNRIIAFDIGLPYYVLQIADYDVDAIIPFDPRQNRPYHQGSRFSQIRYGSQVDLIIPLSDRFEYHPLQPPGMHVEGGIDPVVAIRER